MKRKSHPLITKGILILLSLILLIFISSYAWFTRTDTPVTASGLSVKTSSGCNFDLAIGFLNSKTGGEYKVSDFFTDQSSDLDLTNVRVGGSTYNLLADYKPIDLTGTGGKYLIRPAMGPRNREIDRTVSTYTVPTQNKHYISFDFIFRSTSPCTVCLNENSKVRAICEETVGDGSLITNDTSRTDKSDYGNFSVDAVVGATRVAFTNYDGISSYQDVMRDSYPTGLNILPEFVWIPRSDIYLSPIIGADTFTLHTSDDSDWSDYQNLANVHKYYDVQYPYADVTLQSDKVITKPSDNSIVVVNIKGEGTDEYYYGKTRMNIWVEGLDAEAQRAISGGKFTMNFEFSGK